MQCLGIIPARYQSQRFPGKPLKLIAGKPMIQWVYERASAASTLNEVLVATDDDRVMNAVESFGGKAVMTSGDHQSGTDRVAEVAQASPAELIVNIQGDEPLITDQAIDSAVTPLINNPKIEMGTLACPLPREGMTNPNIVKVVFNRQKHAIYFSRSPIPYYREDGSTAVPEFWQHIGLYVYRRDFLLQFTQYSTGNLEKAERLEQLRALENGHTIYVETTNYHAQSVDTPEDLRQLEQTIQTMDFAE